MGVSATIRLSDGRSHTCVFRSSEASPWDGMYDPPWVRVTHPTWPQYRIYQPRPGVQHRRIVTQHFFGTAYGETEWRSYFDRGLI
jgi:hypothetical protein